VRERFVHVHAEIERAGASGAVSGLLSVSKQGRLSFQNEPPALLNALQVAAILLIFQTHVFHQFQCWLEPVQNTGQAKMDPEFPINKD
jgi:hypothetical protein